MSDMILYPGIEALQKEKERLRTELSMLMTQRDELKFVVCKNIEAIYMLRLGGTEYKAFSLQCKYLRLRRKAEMIRAKLNRQEKIDPEQMEALLDEEFKIYQQKLDDRVRKMKQAAERSQMDALSPADAKEIKKIYRHIVKTLHPDLNPDATKDQINLFQQAVSAYESGNLSALKMIEDMLDTDDVSSDNSDTLEEIQKQCERLKELTERVAEQIKEIKASFPYTEKETIQDEKLIAERRAQLEEIINDYKNAIDIIQKKIAEMTG